MGARTTLGIVGATLLGTAGMAKTTDPTPIATIETGALRGAADDGSVAFKGIPFAAPPVGRLRWRAPQPAVPWSGMRDASRYGHDCMQAPLPGDLAPLATTPAEDCLHANVWRPATKARRLPVMVWIYGGGFVNGGSSPAVYSGAPLARRGIVVVSFNYRLGRFGTFAHPRLTEANADGGLMANYGYMDQLAALRWVRRNIAAFGGDPSDVAVVGESAGGISVHTLVTSPMNDGLFRRAVAMSGGPITLGPTTMASAEAAGLAFARSKGIAAGDLHALDKLRALSAEQLAEGVSMMALFAPGAGPRTFSTPIFDGRLAVDPVAAYRSGRFTHVPMMVGATSDDIGGATGPMIAGAQQFANLLAGQGIPTFYYRFGYVAEAGRKPTMKGAAHATDIPFFLDTATLKFGAATTATDRVAARTASGYLADFVIRGNPNGQGLAFWPAYTGAGRQRLDLTMRGDAELGGE